MGRTKKQIIIIAVLLLLCVGLAAFMYARFPQISSDEAETATEEAAPETPQEADAVFFASDYQIEPGFDEPAVNLKRILKAVADSGIEPSNAILCGDYTNDRNLMDYQLSPEESITEIKGLVTENFAKVKSDDMVFVQGNHDKLSESITPTGLREYDNYLVYVINTEEDFPWKQGRDTTCRDKVIAAANEMKTCLDVLVADGETRPLFIAGHVPLHFTARTSSRHSTGDNMYSSYIFDEVNEAAKDLDIVYLFGHNHSKGWDCYLGGSSVCITPGESILIPDAEGQSANTDKYDAKILNFTYMNAGYLGYYMNCGIDELDNGTWKDYEAADGTLTGTVAEISEGKIKLTRFSADGVHDIRSDGAVDPYKGGIDEGLIDSENYSKRMADYTIERKHNKKNAYNIDYLILVNKEHLLPSDWEENLRLAKEVNSVGDEVSVEIKAYEAYLELKEALAEEGIHVEMDSAYRSVAEQQKIIDDFTEKYGADYAESYAAPPGTSEHHTGLAIDLYLIVDGKTIYENEDLVKYPEIWAKIHKKLPDYGFILRYPKENNDTGYPYEEWHIRYVGKKAAKEITEKGITLDGYLAQ